MKELKCGIGNKNKSLMAGIIKLQEKGENIMSKREKKTIHHKATGNGSATGVWTMRLVRNPQGRSLLLSSESLENSENTLSISGKVPIGLLSTLNKARSQKN